MTPASVNRTRGCVLQGIGGNGERSKNVNESHIVRRKSAASLQPSLGSVDLAHLLARYVTSEGKAIPGALADQLQTFEDLRLLWNEVDKLRFELAGANERTRIAREERQRSDDLYWQLQMAKVPGGPV
jgi:hypothetical protein